MAAEVASPGSASNHFVCGCLHARLQQHKLFETVNQHSTTMPRIQQPVAESNPGSRTYDKQGRHTKEDIAQPETLTCPIILNDRIRGAPSFRG
eukprot:1144009-Pelagomonas_calceolata.AAC.1